MIVPVPRAPMRTAIVNLFADAERPSTGTAARALFWPRTRPRRRAIIHCPARLLARCASMSAPQWALITRSDRGALRRWLSRHNLIFGGSDGDPAMMQSCASATSSETANPFLTAAINGHGTRRSPVGSLKAAGANSPPPIPNRSYTAAFNTTPPGTSPVCSILQRLMSSFRASATTMVLRRAGAAAVLS